MSILLSTENCYEGYVMGLDGDENEGGWTFGSYSELVEMGATNIEWSESAWIDCKDYFADILLAETWKFEKRYNAKVLDVALCGKVGLWNGSPVGGKIADREELLSSMGNVDSIEVEIDDEGVITLHGYHHDGCHSMSVYFLTESKLKKCGALNTYEYDGADYLGYEFFEKLYKNCSPVKVSRERAERYVA